MHLVLGIIGVLVGLFVVQYAAERFIRYSSMIAAAHKISPFLLGLTIMAFGTSLPELLVSLFASIEGHNELVLGNVLGSNIANVLLVLGIPIVLLRRKIEFKDLKIVDISMLVVMTMAFLFFAVSNYSISLIEGELLIVLYIAYLLYQIKKNPHRLEEKVVAENEGIIKSYGLTIISIIGLLFGARLVVWSAVVVTQAVGLSDTSFIAQTLIAVGTSLPELSVAYAAIKKNQPGLVLGSIIGSNIVNMLIVTGLPSLVNPLPITPVTYFAGGGMLFLSTGLLVGLYLRGKVSILEAWSYLMFYVFFLALSVLYAF